MTSFRSMLVLLTVGFSILGVGSSLAEPPENQAARLYLHKDWQIQSSCEAKTTGEQVSSVGYDTKNWHRVDAPTTVVGALITDKTYPDPFWAKNLRDYPGTFPSNKELFANHEMPEGSPFRCSWWYRTEFNLPGNYQGKKAWLNFLGINYRANLWVNGKKVADKSEVAGAYRTFEFNVSEFVQPGKRNAFAVEVFAPEKDDLEITWVDWNPTPADKMMGVWREVFLTESGEISLRNPFVASKLGPDYKSAELTVSVEVRNASSATIKGVLHAELQGFELQQNVELAGGESKIVKFSPGKFAKLKLEHPQLWWPYQMGSPTLQTAKLSFESAKRISDRAEVTYGIREVTSELTDKGHRLFKVNGRKVLIRGAAWDEDMFLRWSSAKLDADLAYVHDMGLNTVRLEGHLDRDEFFEKTDRLGILVMPGWSCCDAWERWDDWKGDQKSVAAASLVSQIDRLRNHPSVMVWLYGSDGPPPADVEQMYLDILAKLEWPNPSLSSASETPTKVTGISGVKMTGPYEYVPPIYWLADKEAGGAYGYNTETSPGPAIPTRQSLEKFIPKDHLWPIDDVWNFHAGGERFTTVNVFTDGLTRRYGLATSLDDYERKSQAMTYDGQRAMFEAYARNKYTSTGVIQWMLNNAWPSLIWHLYDYYLVPAGGYYGTKKACEPVHVQYSYDDNSVAVINGTQNALLRVKVNATLYNLDATEAATHGGILDLAPDSSTKALDLPVPEKISTTYFLKLQLHDEQGKLLSDNFYWLSTKADTLDWAHRSDTVYTPQKEFADLTELNNLPTARVGVSKVLQTNGSNSMLTVTAENKSKSVAFMVHPRVTRGKGGEDITPILWSDNYFSLLPGEKKTVIAKFDASALGGASAELVVEGWNMEPTAP
jgi:exo-1,4-beta-D-glucosaminidase